MSCEQYSSGTNADITLTEHTLPVGFCPSTWQDVLHGFLTAISGNLSGTYSTFVVSATVPAPADQDKVWLKVDSATCHPEGFYLFFNGAWCRVDGSVFYGEDASTTIGIMNVPSLEPNVAWLETTAAKQIFVIKANTGNTGTVTLQLPLSIAALPVTKAGSSPLEGYEILPGMLCMFAYDIAHGSFQLLNPRPVIPQTQQELENPSFEIDADGDGQPDSWVRYNTFGTGTGIIDTIYPVHGVKCYKMQVYAPVAPASQNGYESITTQYKLKCDPGEIIYITWQMCVDAVAGNKPAQIGIYEYNNAGNMINLAHNPTVIWSSQLNLLADIPQPPGAWAKFGAIFVPGVTTTAFTIEIRVGDAAASGKVPNWIYFDDIRIGLPVFPNKSVFDNTHAYADTATLGSQLNAQWTCPTGKFSARVRAWAGGGAGTTYHAGSVYGGGGGGGGYSESFVTVIPGTAYAIAVGFAGQISLSSAGTDTSFNLAGTQEVLAHGGQPAVLSAGGNGGAVGTGTIAVGGENGQNGGATYAGFGGACPNGGGQGHGGIAGATYGTSFYPGGGGGGSGGGAFSGFGTSGSNGALTVEWF